VFERNYGSEIREVLVQCSFVTMAMSVSRHFAILNDERNHMVDFNLVLTL